MTRLLPGAYVTLNDLSQFAEGDSALTVGCVLKANRGPINEAKLVTSPSDFLTKFTLTGKPKTSDDPTFWSILNILSRTNQMYVVRCAKDPSWKSDDGTKFGPRYGGVLVRKQVSYGNIKSINYTNNSIETVSSTAPAVNEIIAIVGSADGVIDGNFTVVSATKNTNTYTIVLKESLVEEGEEKLPAIYGFEAVKTVGTKTLKFNIFADSSTEPTALYNIDGSKYKGTDFVVSNKIISYKYTNPETQVTETLTCAYKSDLTPVYGSAHNVALAPLADGLVNPKNYGTVPGFGTNDLMLIAGIDPGKYNNDLLFELTSSVDNTDMTYRKGVEIGGVKCTFDTMQLVVKIASTGDTLESFVFSRDRDAKTIDGTPLYVTEVINGSSAYIQVIDNEKAEVAGLASYSTLKDVQGNGGSDGEAADADDLAGSFRVFNEKTIPLSILSNGCSTDAETNVVQQAMLSVVDTRKDCMAFLNAPAKAEAATLPSDKASNIVSYKKGTLGSTSYYGCMYAPHVNYTDSINSRQVSIGSDSVAISGWLNIISGIGYPYAYAGPKNGLVSGVTCDWKIGDESGEALILNDASVNYIAYDGKVGRYYMQAQNTLQVANSSLRNIGGVLNVLDIKEHIAAALKEYINLPITDDLRRDILANIRGYLSPMEGVRFYNYAFQDATTAADIAQDTLRYILTLSLTRYANKIYCAINVVNSLFDFSLLQSA